MAMTMCWNRRNPTIHMLMAYVERVICMQISCSIVADENLSVSESMASSMLKASIISGTRPPFRALSMMMSMPRLDLLRFSAAAICGQQQDGAS